MVEAGSGSNDPRHPIGGIALCLRGGYKVKLFHTGSQRPQVLPKLTGFLLVSSESITAGGGGIAVSGVSGFVYLVCGDDGNRSFNHMFGGLKQIHSRFEV